MHNKTHSFISKAAKTSWLVSFFLFFFSKPFSHLALVPLSQVSKPEWSWGERKQHEKLATDFLMQSRYLSHGQISIIQELAIHCVAYPRLCHFCFSRLYLGHFLFKMILGQNDRRAKKKIDVNWPYKNYQLLLAWV